MKPTYEELERERNELAAQVERFRGVLKNLVRIDHKKGGSLGPSGAFYYKVSEHLFGAAESVLSEPPPAALAALKAQCQAEAVDRCEKEVTESVNVLLKPHIAGVFAVIRQRAQEAGDVHPNNPPA